MERKTKGLGNRPISAARDRPEFGFSILEKAALHRHSKKDPDPSGSAKGIRTRYGVMRKSSSFSGKSVSRGEGEKLSSVDGSELARQTKAKKMARPKTHPELLNRDRSHFEHPFPSEFRPPFTPKFPQELATTFYSAKVLLNVTVLQSIGALRVLVSKDATVRDVIRAAIDVYAKEGRMPLLATDPAFFGLHFSQFSIDRLNPADRIKDLGSRNFFLCPLNITENARITSLQTGSAGVSSAASCRVPSSSCGRQMENASRITRSWYNVMDCILLIPSSSRS